MVNMTIGEFSERRCVVWDLEWQRHWDEFGARK